MSTAADDQTFNFGTAADGPAPASDRTRLVDLLVTAAANPADREWMNLTAGMYSLLAWVEPLAILREIALKATSGSSEEVGLCAAS